MGVRKCPGLVKPELMWLAMPELTTTWDKTAKRKAARGMFKGKLLCRFRGCSDPASRSSLKTKPQISSSGQVTGAYREFLDCSAVSKVGGAGSGPPFLPTGARPDQEGTLLGNGFGTSARHDPPRQEQRSQSGQTKQRTANPTSPPPPCAKTSSQDRQVYRWRNSSERAMWSFKTSGIL